LGDARIKQQKEELEKQILIANNNKQAFQLSETAKELKDKQLKSQKQLRNLMIGGMALLIILGIVLFSRYKLGRKLQQQREMLEVRNNIAKNLHDEIGSALTSIKILSQVSQNSISKDQQKASTMLGMITEQSSQMQQGMSDIVWAISPENDKLEDLVIRIREFIARTLEPKNIHTVLTVDEPLLTKSLGMEQRRDFFLIIKEAINNAAKYSEASQVDIHLSGDKTNILLSIRDNGIGFDTNSSSSSNGLRNMRARTEALNGVFTLLSAPGKGVILEVSIPQT
jgi:signal transduction histidine kinase